MNSFLEKNNISQTSEFQENLNILRQIYFFSELPMEALKVFAYLCTRENFKQDEKIFTQGEDDGRAYYIMSGKAGLSRITDNEELFIRDCGEGDFFGALLLVGKLDRLFSLTAVVDTVCLVVNREKFGKAIEQFPELMSAVLQALAENVASWEERFLRDQSDCPTCRNSLGASLL